MPRKSNWYIIGAVVLAIVLSAILNWRIAVGVPKHDVCFPIPFKGVNLLTNTDPLQYCLILDDKFETLDESIWSHQVQIDGFGTDSFDWTTTDSRNAFTDKDGLHIVPSFTTDTTDITQDEILDG